MSRHKVKWTALTVYNAFSLRAQTDDRGAALLLGASAAFSLLLGAH